MGWGSEESKNNQLPDYDNIFPIEIKKVPFLGEIACGEPIFANEERESYVLAGTNINADFCLKARGDSMTGARIYDGDIVFIREQSMVENGEIAAVIIDDEATLKRVYYEKEKNKLYLQAENPKYPPLSYEGEELDHIRILGKAIIFQSDVI
ncbi:LexA family protein [Zhenpiania hominis]|uniref:LexA family protein n=1 Tax=Zhenpiania hominis TaxID=2763644 RepID=UPI0039F57892